jgi:hypothetical protein
MGINRVGHFWLKNNKPTPPPLPKEISQEELGGEQYFYYQYKETRKEMIRRVLDQKVRNAKPSDSGMDLTKATPPMRHEVYDDEVPSRERKESETTYVRNIVGATVMAAAFILSFAAGSVVSSRKQEAISTPSYVRPKEADDKEAPEPDEETQP